MALDTALGITFSLCLLGLYLWVFTNRHEENLRAVGRNMFLIFLVIGVLIMFFR